MGNLIVQQVQFLLEKMNLRQNSYRQVEGMRRSKRMRVTSPLMSLSSLFPAPLSLPSLSCPSLSCPSLSCPSLSPLFHAPLSPAPLCPLSPLSFLPLSLPCLSVSLISSPVSPPLSLLSFTSVSFSLSSISLSCLSPCSVSPSPVSTCSCPLSPPIGRYLFLHPVSITYHSSLSVPHLYTPYTTITV